MSRVAVVVLMIACAHNAKGDQSTPRLYVRTSPPAALIFLNGEYLGLSDGLFPVAQGAHQVRIEHKGYATVERRVRILPGEIIRLDIALAAPEASEEDPPVSRGADAPADESGKPESARSKTEPGKRADTKAKESAVRPNSLAAGKAAAAFVRRLELEVERQKAIAVVLRQHPEQTRWSGQDHSGLFAVSSERLPSGRLRAGMTPSFLKLSRVKAVNELMKAKSLLARYKAQGLSDATTLSRAMALVAGRLDIVGNVQGLTHQAGTQGDYAVAYVSAQEESIVAFLLRPAALGAVKAAYRDTLHSQMRQLMRQQNWVDALACWRQLHERELVSPALYLDAARCFKARKKLDEVVDVVDEAMRVFEKEEDWSFFNGAGDLLLDIKTPRAQDLAVKAFETAFQKFRLKDAPAKQAPDTVLTPASPEE